MHEGAIIRSLLDVAHQVQLKENLTTVTKLIIVVGKMHQIIPQVLITNFDYMKTEYPGMENALLEMQETDVQIRCRDCQKLISLETPDFHCPACGSTQTEVVSGNELYIDSLEGS
ncbi:MAG: hydrogenase maturation nickel metallochaperone HypA [Candidatus Cloacimonetes bacterium]|nr:hydrogenase maturation nickel metallochaperone HypA [Candidatus Cloacimonadota bacterium]